MSLHVRIYRQTHFGKVITVMLCLLLICKGGVDGLADTAIAVPPFEVEGNAAPLIIMH